MNELQKQIEEAKKLLPDAESYEGFYMKVPLIKDNIAILFRKDTYMENGPLGRKIDHQWNFEKVTNI